MSQFWNVAHEKVKLLVSNYYCNWNILSQKWFDLADTIIYKYNRHLLTYTCLLTIDLRIL